MHSSVSEAIAQFKNTLEFLSKEFSTIQVGRASSSLVEGIQVEVYGAKQPLKNMAQIAIPDPRSIAITPWDKTALEAIEKAVQESSLGISPVNDGVCIRINIPPLTEETRKQRVKVVHEKAENAKVAIRQGRHTAMEKIKKDEELSEDEEKRAEKELQEEVDKINKEIDEHTKKKEEEVMKV